MTSVTVTPIVHTVEIGDPVEQVIEITPIIHEVEILIGSYTGSSDHFDLFNIGVKTHVEIDAHLNSVVPNPHGVTHAQLPDIGTYNHSAIDAHILDASKHIGDAPADGLDYVRNNTNWVLSGTGITDHTLLSNIGVTTHDDIDLHISDTDIHFTMDLISITKSQVSDFSDADYATAAQGALADTALQSETSHADVVVDGDIGVTVAAQSHNHAGVYLPILGKANDSDKLDGYNHTDFLKLADDYIAGHHPEGRIMANAALVNDFANARLRGSTISVNQFAWSDTYKDNMFDGTAVTCNGTTASLSGPLVIEFDLPRTLQWSAWVGIGFGNVTWRFLSVKIETFTEGVWQTTYETTTNDSEDVFVQIPGNLGIGTTDVRITLDNPNYTSWRIAHIWGFNYNSEMWQHIQMPRAGGTMYGALDVGGAVTGDSFNGVVLATGGLATNFLNEQGNYVAGSGGGSTTLEALTDTTITGLTDAEVLVSASGQWINQTLSEAGIEPEFAYNNATPMPEALGGLDAGTTFTDSSLQELFDGLLYPYVPPSVSLSVNPTNSLREFGNDVVNPILTATPVEGSVPIATIEFKRGSTSLQIHATDTDYTDIFTVDVNTTYSVEVDDGTTVDSASKTYSFVYPYYYGSGAPGLTAAQVAGLSKVIQSNGDKTWGFAPTNQVYYFAYPAAYGTLNNIYDWNQFVITNDFTLRVENITGLDGSAQSYNIYEFNNLVTHTSENIRFDT